MHPGFSLLRILCAQYLFLLAPYPIAAQDSVNHDYTDQLPRIAPLEPAEAMGSFETLTGLKIELLASEPQVVDPVAIAFDEFGRAFVAEMRGYSLRQEQRLGRIKLLEDRDGDGHFESDTIFAEALQWPTAVCCVFGGILVADAPDLWFLKDLDGDGQADLRERVFTGFGTSNIQQLLNNLHWGIDHRIYGAGGGNGGHIVQLGAIDPSGYTPVDPDQQNGIHLRGRDFVIDPQTFRMQAIAGGGQFGLTFDGSGNRMVCSNSDHCQQIVLGLRYSDRNPLSRIATLRQSIASDGPAAPVFRISPVEPWRVVRTRLRVQGLVSGPIEGGGRAAGYFTSATGIHWYGGDALPASFSNQVFIGDVGSNLVHRKKLESDGIVQSAHRVDPQTEFIRSRDNWFRPVQLTDGPDGSLVILDMYREVVEHPASLPPIIKKHLDLASGHDRGRIYRVRSAEGSFETRLLPGDATPVEWVRMLAHANRWHRETASRLLAQQIIDEATREKLRSMAAHGEMPESRIRALYLLSDDREIRAVTSRALTDPVPAVRVHAIRLAESFVKETEMQKRILAMVSDQDIRVRYQLALTLSLIESPEADRVFVKMAMRDGSERWMRDALACAMVFRRGEKFAALTRGVTASNREIVRPIMTELAWQLARQSNATEREVVIDSLAELSQRHELLAGELLFELQGHAETTSIWQQSVANSTDESLRSLSERTIKRSFQIANDTNESQYNRIRAISVLRHAPEGDFVQVLPEWIKWEQPSAVKIAALEIAARFSDAKIAEVVINALPTQSPEVRGRCVSVLLRRTPWTERLLTAIEQGSLPPVLLGASIRQQLASHPDDAIRAAARRLLPGGDPTDRGRLVQRYLNEMESLEGDVHRGRAAFRKSCASCHQLEGQGNRVGPDLAAFGNRGAHAIVANVLNPNQEVDPRYLSYRLLMSDGRMLLGILADETNSYVSIQDDQGQSRGVPRSDIEEISATTLSLMPENLETEIDPQTMSDIVEYLLSLVNQPPHETNSGKSP